MKKITKHTNPADLATALYKNKEIEVSESLQLVQANVEMAAEILTETGSKAAAALRLMENLKCTLPAAYYYLSKAQQQEPELGEHTRKWFVWMLMEEGMQMMADMRQEGKRKYKEEVALLKTMGEWVKNFMGDKEKIDFSKLAMPDIIVLQSLPEVVNSEWQGKTDKEITAALAKILKLDDNPELNGITDIDFEEYEE